VSMLSEALENDKVTGQSQLETIAHRTEAVLGTSVNIEPVEENKLQYLLLESQQRIQDVLDNSKFFVWSYDADNKTFTYCASGVDDMMGISRIELSVHPDIWRSMIHPEDKHILTEAFDNRHAGNPFDIECRFLRRDGVIKWIQVVGRHDVMRDNGRVNRSDGIVLDVTERKTSQLSSKEHRARYEALLNFLPDAIVVHRDGEVLYGNDSTIRMMGLQNRADIVGRTIWQFVDESGRETIRARFTRILGAESIGYSLPPIELTIIRMDGSTFYGEIRSVVVEDQRQLAILTMVKDISAQKIMRDELQHMAFHDALTGLPNRRHFVEHLGRVIREGTLPDAGRHAVLFLDMDRFKDTNDIYGHAFGDEVLRMVASRLQSVMPPNSLLSRIGGDEFAVILPDCANEAEALQQASRMVRSFDSPLVVRGQVLIFAPSIGIAFYPRCGQEVDTLLKRADLAMYSAKHKGGNRFEVYQPEDETAIEERVTLELGLRRGLANGEFFVLYQPKVSISDGRLASAEALVRWRAPNGVIYPPDKFIPVAEESGVIVELGEWVLRQSCLQNRIWQDKGYQPIVISVNVSPRQFQLQNMFEVVKKVLIETKLQPEWLAIEITEGLLVQNSSEIAQVLKQIRDYGVQIAIDDFGTGYSSLGYLRLFNPTHLKIDQSFVDRMLTSEGDMCIVSAVVNLAHNLSMQVVAEGVETSEQFDRLKDEGCDTVQGYLFSKPISSTELESHWLEAPTDANCEPR